MWREARLAFTDKVGAINCSVVPAHPWIFGLGQQTDNGAYLSPVNAVSWLSTKIAGKGGNADVVIFMVTGQTHASFMTALDALADVFPAPLFTQVKRLAGSSASLALEKMQIPARTSGGLPPSTALSVPTSRTALAAAAIKKAQSEAGASAGIGQIKQQLTEFGEKRDTFLAEIAAGLDDLQGKSTRVWVFTGRGDLATTLKVLAQDIPEPSAVFTAAMMMVGDNLEGIRSMIHECKPDTGA